MFSSRYLILAALVLTQAAIGAAEGDPIPGAPDVTPAISDGLTVVQESDQSSCSNNSYRVVVKVKTDDTPPYPPEDAPGQVYIEPATVDYCKTCPKTSTSPASGTDDPSAGSDTDTGTAGSTTEICWPTVYIYIQDQRAGQGGAPNGGGCSTCVFPAATPPTSTSPLLGMPDFTRFLWTKDNQGLLPMGDQVHGWHVPLMSSWNAGSATRTLTVWPQNANVALIWNTTDLQNFSRVADKGRVGEGAIWRDGDTIVVRDANGRRYVYALPAGVTPATLPTLQPAKIILLTGAEYQFSYLNGRLSAIDGPIGGLRFAWSQVGGAWVITTVTGFDGRDTTYGYVLVSGKPTLHTATHPDGTVDVVDYDRSRTWSQPNYSTPATTALRMQNRYTGLGRWRDVTYYLESRLGRARLAEDAFGRDLYYRVATGQDAGLLWRQFVESDGRQIRTWFDGNANLVRREDLSTGTEIRLGWNSAKQVVSRRDSLGRTWAFERLPQNYRVASTTFPDGSRESRTYQPGTGMTLTKTDELGRTTRWDRDGRGLPSKIVFPDDTPADNSDNPSQAFTWNSIGQILTATDELGRKTMWYYALDGQPASGVCDPAAYGFPVMVDMPGDAPGTTVTWKWQWDTVRKDLIRITDPKGIFVDLAYDPAHRLLRRTYAGNPLDYESWTYGTGRDAGLLIASRDRNGNVTKIDYDDCGLETLRTLPDGTAIARTYDSRGRLASRTTAGEREEYTYDAAGRQAKTTRFTAPGRSLASTRQYDAAERVWAESDAFGRSTFRAFDLRDRVLSTLRERLPGAAGLATPLSIWPARILGGNPPFVIEQSEYDLAGQTLARIDANGRRASFAYDPRGRMTVAVADVGGLNATSRYGYDLVGNRETVTSPRGVVTRTSYTGRNLAATVIEADDTPDERTQVRSLSYTTTGKVEVERDANGNETLLGYGTCCDRLVTVTDAGGKITSFTYDDVGNRLTVTDPNGVTTKTSYDSRNRVSSVTIGITKETPTGEKTTYRYDENICDGLLVDADPAVRAVAASLGWSAAGESDGSAVEVTDPLGQRSVELRDGLGRMVARISLGTSGAPVVTRLTYDALHGDVVEQTQSDGLGHVSRIRSDGLGRAVELLDAMGVVTNQVFDGVGNQLAQIRRVARPGQPDEVIGWSASYDGLHRMDSRSDTREVDRGTTFWGYDLDGNRLSEDDAAGKTERSVYDRRNRRITLTDRVGGVTRFGYDAVGNLVVISDADNEPRGGLAYVLGCTQYGYDARNLLIAEAFPAGQRGRTLRRYAYDAGRRLELRQVGILSGSFSQVAAFAGAAESTRYDYVGPNRLVSRRYADGRNDGFVYDGAGRLVEASSGRYGNVVRRDYDGLGRLSAEHLEITAGVGVLGRTVVPAQYTVRYGYDADSQVVTLTYPDGRLVHRSYTPRHELATVSLSGAGQLAERSYDAAGRLERTTFGNGVVETRSHVAGDVLTQRLATAAPGAPALLDLGYDYDVDRRKLHEYDHRDGTQTQAFTYDGAGRLTSWQRGSATQSWDLSLVGDWRSTTRDGVAQTRQNSFVHEAARVGDRSLAYDVKGNLVVDERGQVLLWDSENRLQTALNLGGSLLSAASYAYDALGRRVSTTIGSERTDWVSAGAQVVQAYQQRATVTRNELAQEGTPGALHQRPAGGGLIQPRPGQPVIRVNCQPAYESIPTGYLADKGRIYGARTSGQRYGWTADRSSGALVRGVVADAAWDTLIPLDGQTWRIRLPVGSYPVAVVAGDAASVESHNDLTLNGELLADPDQPAATPGYPRGDFDGWVRVVTVVDDAAAGTGFGFLSIAAGPEAVQPKLCFVEIGPRGTIAESQVLAAAAEPRMVAAVRAQTDATVGGAQARQVKTFVYGSYVDEVLAYTVGQGAQQQRYYPHYNHLYSVAALTGPKKADGTVDVVERYTYNAYGQQRITDASGNVTRAKSVVGWDRGFTGYIADNESGYLFARNRMYSPTLGRFTNRDPVTRKYSGNTSRVFRPEAFMGYYDGMSLYQAYFVPTSTDPSGFGTAYCCKPGDYYWTQPYSGDQYSSYGDAYKACLDGQTGASAAANVVGGITSFTGAGAVGESTVAGGGTGVGFFTAAGGVLASATGGWAFGSLAGCSMAVTKHCKNPKPLEHKNVWIEPWYVSCGLGKGHWGTVWSCPDGFEQYYSHMGTP